ncbi:formate dehydrogenase subunit gamma [Marinobacter daepoensis]|uniref:Formate dehydrogenase subunit gamma n=1 Tax=Marinobacter daepoensis TaxID=262077 RepID=A0ABS3B9U9_9GAMM|nr:formate dehydrogenase subunit gamma [Marinobacter daepoensis]MBN7768648.1 formate dehydrogenase subunit gamma [Marinobacter daepoensis]MBY6032893.1 formate dehydrogenase subunit gamma [Marinobacter daepoensis]MBY6079385.1 formate dehydrogenase subunit gamma [Marinobacter daepoensis]
MNGNENQDLQRYNANERSNHWAVALLFVLAALSGLALFHPALFWLTNLFGGGPWTRILHPFIGVAMMLFFLGLAFRFAGRNRFKAHDRQWLSQWRDVISNQEENLPRIGKYNAGQKLLFWVLVISMLALLFSGIVIWREYFSDFFGIGMIRFASLLHAFAAFVLITSIIVHVYAAIWVKGSVGAMTSGKVSRAWARKHHALWYDEVRKNQR